MRAPGSTPATGFEYLVNALRQGLNDVGFVVMTSRRLRSPPGPKPVASGPELVRDGGCYPNDREGPSPQSLRCDFFGALQFSIGLLKDTAGVLTDLVAVCRPSAASDLSAISAHWTERAD